MHPSGSCKCRHCGEFFQPDARNRGRQHHCRKVACRKARKAASQQAWLQQEGNRDYFRGEVNVARVQAWRRANPGYAKRDRRRRAVALQDALVVQPVAAESPAKQDAAVALQDLLSAQPPVVVGLVAHLTGMTLQDDIAAMMRTLHSRGRAVLGIDVGRPDYAKTPDRFGTGAAYAAPV
jgi:hypothetical protein